ncbi:MAG: SDR family NAD(P)-dependent oxidoreductase [Candidatus Tectimicrobiota bacterium]
MGQLNGKVAAVTGGASGIGEATVRRFIAEGAQVAFADRDVERGQRIAAEIEASGGKALFVATQIEQEAAVTAFIQSAVEHFGPLNILVNNAGIRMYQTVVEASAESWHTLLGVNLMGYIFCAKAAIPAMRRAGGGSIVNIASVRSITAGENTIQYDTSKAAVAGLTRGLARDHATEGIRVNAVCPGPILTPFHERRIAAAGKTLDDYRAEHGSRTMLKRPGTPQEVAACVLFLASDEASYVTGTCLFVDGGYTAM